MVVPFWTPITPLTGSFLHADPHQNGLLFAQIATMLGVSKGRKVDEDYSMTVDAGSRCGDDDIQQVVALAGQSPAAGIQAIEVLQTRYPDDPRLHFLRGSLLIGQRRHIAAHAALSRAVELDPGMVIARFQLGFFELTSGEVDASRQTLAPLLDLPDSHYLKQFALGLNSLVHDRFAECVDHLRRGQSLNQENVPLNRDMELIIGKCQELAGSAPSTDEDFSATSLMLRTPGVGQRLN
eukprot:gene19410-19828_t